MTTKEKSTCPSCGKYWGSVNFALYKCPHCQSIVCNSCKHGRPLCQTCRKANYEKIR